MSYKIEDIKPNSAKAVWNIAYTCAAADGSISQEEHVGMVNTFAKILGERNDVREL